MGKYDKKEETEVMVYVRGIQFDVDVSTEEVAEQIDMIVSQNESRLKDELMYKITCDFEEDKDYDELPEGVKTVDDYINAKQIDFNAEIRESAIRYYKETVLGLPMDLVFPYEYRVGEGFDDITTNDIVSALEKRYGYTIADSDKLQFSRAKGTEIAKQNIKDGIENVINGQGFQNFLDLTSNFQSYSFNNKMLVFSQKPTATIIKGGKTWKDEWERYINKGEKAIWIYAPLKQTFKEEEKLVQFIEEKNKFVGVFSDFYIGQKEADRLLATLKEKGSVSIITGFKVVPVYDISQTNGKEIDIDFMQNINKEMSDFENIKNALVDVCKNHKVQVVFKEKSQDSKLETAYGYYDTVTNNITVCTTDRSEQDQIKTLVHEMAHSLMHGKEMKVLGIASSTQVDKSMREVEAEATAYMVCKELGIDSGCRSFGYMAEYLPLDKGLRNKAFETSFKRIDECMKQIKRDFEKVYVKEATDIKQEAVMEERDI